MTEQWIIENISTHSLGFYDLPRIPAIEPGKKANALAFYAKDIVAASSALSTALRNNLVRLIVRTDTDEFTATGADAIDAMSTVQKYGDTARAVSYDITTAGTFAIPSTTDIIVVDYAGDSVNLVKVVLPSPTNRETNCVYILVKLVSSDSGNTDYTTVYQNDGVTSIGSYGRFNPNAAARFVSFGTFWKSL